MVDNNDVKIYYPDTIEYQPFTSEAVEVTNDTGSTSNKTASGTEAQGGTVINKARKFPPRPIPIPVVAKEVIGNNLNSQSRQILSAFTFNQTGSIQIGEYVSGSSGDIRISPNGLVARNSAGVTTVSIDGTTGDASFLGTVSAGSVISAEISANLITGTIVNAQIATIDWAKITNVQIETADITSLDASVITSGTINASTINVTNLNASNLESGNVPTNRMTANVLDALQVNVSELSAITANIGTITAGSITGITITGTTITGGTIRTASASTRVEMSQTDNELRVYSGSTKIVQVDEGGIWIRGGNVLGLGGSSSGGQTCQIYENGSLSGNLVISAGNIITLNGAVNCVSLNSVGYLSGTTLTTSSWISVGGDIDMNGKLIKELNTIEWNTRSNNSGASWALYMYSSGGSYSLRTRMNGNTWKVDQTSA